MNTPSMPTSKESSFKNETAQICGSTVLNGNLKSLRVVAVSAPEFPFGRSDTESLGGKDPVSLYNATRYAAHLADNGVGAWRQSNWFGGRDVRKEKFLLMTSMEEDRNAFVSLLEKESPNLLLIGAMTLCLPGAIECASIAKKMFGDKIFIVLGGKHANETMFRVGDEKKIQFHPSSPLELMKNSTVPNVFDLVVAGEAEKLIAKIGDIVSDHQENSTAVIAKMQHNGDGMFETEGDWIVGFLRAGNIHARSGNAPLEKSALPSHVFLFGTRTAFDVFPNSMTAQLFSHASMGCAYECHFCSEKRSLSYGRYDKTNASNILSAQMTECVQVISSDYPHMNASAFVEDSILLGGSRSNLEELIQLRSLSDRNLLWGCQFTVDIANRNMDIMPKLHDVGLRYVFFGLETVSADIANGMSKNVGKNDWVDRAQSVIHGLSRAGIQTGVALLFGLGESQDDRIKTIDLIADWRNQFGNPKVVSFNWAVQHPMQDVSGDSPYLYNEWGVRDPEFVRAFRDFGEASCAYPMRGVEPPCLKELNSLSRHIRRTLVPQ